MAYLSGPDGVVSADAGRVSGDGYALLFNEFTVNTVADPATVREYAELSMGAKSRNGKDVFMASHLRVPSTTTSRQRRAMLSPMFPTVQLALCPFQAGQFRPRQVTRRSGLRRRRGRIRPFRSRSPGMTKHSLS